MAQPDILAWPFVLPDLSGGLHLQVVPEPVDRWQSVGVGSHNILDAFYEQPERYAYTFQNYVFVTRMMQVAVATWLLVVAIALLHAIFAD